MLDFMHIIYTLYLLHLYCIHDLPSPSILVHVFPYAIINEAAGRVAHVYARERKTNGEVAVVVHVRVGGGGGCRRRCHL